MSPAGWLLVAAAVLALMAGWCANAEAALTLVAATGVAERPEHKGTLQAVAADLPRYMSVLLLLRIVLECLCAVVVTAAFVHWLSDDWRAVLAGVGVVIVLHYALTGVRPQLGRIGPRTERTAERAARFLYPLTRALGPLPGLLVSVGNAMPPGRRTRPAEDRQDAEGLVDHEHAREPLLPFWSGEIPVHLELAHAQLGAARGKSFVGRDDRHEDFSWRELPTTIARPLKRRSGRGLRRAAQ